MTTPLDALVAVLRAACGYNPGAEAAPEALVWCDPNQEFLSLIPALQDRLPELLTLGDYQPDRRTGPAVWIRAVVAGALPEATLQAEGVPIIYLPGVSREALKGADDCPAPLQLLVWYTVSGNLFGHINGKDWTLRAFLTSERGALRLSIADDGLTRMALAQATSRFFSKSIDDLLGKRWDADAINALLAPDIAADMLDWIDGVLDEGADPERFSAFAAIADKQLKLDPRKLSRQDAAKRLAKREGGWSDIWERFAASTGRAGVVGLLGAEEPSDMFESREPYPRENQKGEDELRKALIGLGGLAPADARAQIIALEKDHAWRRMTVWAKRGSSPLAQALEHLVQIASARPLPSHNGNEMAAAYINDGASIDGAAMRALAAVPRDIDRNAVSAAVRAIYMPWLEEGAVALQELIKAGKVKLAGKAPQKIAAKTIVFVDGLRMDLAQDLARLLALEGVASKLSWQWSGFPTVTATCKALVSPVGHLLSGPETTSDALPIAPDGRPVVKAVLYKMLASEGWETGNSLLPDSKLWTETGRFDEDGHALGARLAGQLNTAVQDVADHILALIRVGRSVRVVTDHGWLLMPGGLPKAELETGLVEPSGKRTRCAMVKHDAHTTYLQLPWSWNQEVFVAAATGIRSFFSGQEYAHGGVSPQECIIPILEIQASSFFPKNITISEARWEGLRIRITVAGGADLQADLRLGDETSGPSLIKGGRVLDDKGKTSVPVSDEYEGQNACLVILDDVGSVLAHRVLKIGVE